jgi:hypothetical protein
MIIRIGTIPEYQTWRARLARWLRRGANRIDHATVLILASDNARLKAQCVQGCTRLFLQEQAEEFMREHADEIDRVNLAEALKEWEPSGERVQ